MQTRLQKWGNSQGIRLPKDLLEEAHLQIGDEVVLVVDHGRIIVEPLTRMRGRYQLKDLLADMPENEQPEEIGWGKPMGKEIW